MSEKVIPLSLRNTPALIERVLPVQKLSSESFKEQEARQAKALTALGSYWKGRKPLILNKACVLGCLLPATNNPKRDLEIFELLMGMDDRSLAIRRRNRPKLSEIAAALPGAEASKYFLDPAAGPASATTALSNTKGKKLKIAWRDDISESERRRIEAKMLPPMPYKDLIEESFRPEEVGDDVHAHIWDEVNSHLGTDADSFPSLIEQLGIMRFGHRPRVGDTFSGSGQIPFEAARLGCDVYASDLNPIACMLTWGAFNIVGDSIDGRSAFEARQETLFNKVRDEIDRLSIESDGDGWLTKAFLYCIEVTCPISGWAVPLLPSRIISGGHKAYVKLIPNVGAKRYEIEVCYAESDDELSAASAGNVKSDGRGQDPYMIHYVDGREIKVNISTLRGDFKTANGPGNKLRLWEKCDFIPKSNDIFRERLYAILWVKPNGDGKRSDHVFRSVNDDDISREKIVEAIVSERLVEWQEKGWVPDMRIEPGAKTDEPVRTRGWTHWHHLFNARQLLTGALINKHSDAHLKFALTQAISINSRISRWNALSGVGQTAGAFDNQALNTLLNYGCRGVRFLEATLRQSYASYPLPNYVERIIRTHPAENIEVPVDVFITDPPYGDAVKYEEILEFYIAWLRSGTPSEFSGWIWDSRRDLAIKGEGEDFRRNMVSSYRKMAQAMPDNGIQVVMFTHQSGTIWADMANIVWASGLQVTAAWYVVTETDSALRNGANVKGTVLLVLRKRTGALKTSRDDLGYEIQEEVEKQISDLTGLNQLAKGLYRDANVFEDADVQMAGYAAALRVLTRYAVIDGKDMPAEALRPRIKGEITFVDKLITFAVDTANQCLVPEGIVKPVWDALSGPERFYLKLLELEAKSIATLDNYQNFAKAFKVADFQPLMASSKANKGRLRSAKEFKATEMGEGSQLYQSPLRCMLYAIKELAEDVDGDDVLKHLALNIPSYYDQATRDVILAIADFLAAKLEHLRPDEASSARVLRDLVRNQRIG